MDQVMTSKEGLHNWITQHETEEEEESEQARESVNGSGPHTAESDQDSPIYTDKVNTHLEAENNAIEERIMELSTKQKLELRNSKLTLQKKQQFSDLKKAKLESKLMLERKRHHMMEEYALNQVLNMSRVQQQSILESIHVPRGELQLFSGDELKYWPFIKSFKYIIDCLSLPVAQKLASLQKYCRGRAALTLKSTSYKSPEKDYKRALEILEERFGNPYNITCEWVRKVTSRPEVKRAADLREYTDELSCCLESLKKMKSLYHLGSGDNMLKIVKKLPFYLQTRWIKTNHEIRSRYKRSAEITEPVKFINDAADEASDPVFGSLVSRDQKRDKGRCSDLSLFNCSIGQLQGKVL
ncbi:hypothetical protein Pmani_006446 [Petrolisthes manimaculis]|uniref:Uncharacterized protein n=1 Tax=Petrolisthes manimaculis TaxID=1843537 RepID=A0AAE1QA88_9EUCA|nr:hypothetical protein Pmani_006446 [Petrolisthes manimaculis]